MENGGWRMTDGEWRMADGGWRMTDGEWRMADKVVDEMGDGLGLRELVDVQS